MRLTVSKSKKEKAVVLSKRNSTLFQSPDLRPDPVGRIVQGYFDVDVRNSHDGLLTIARRDFKRNGLDVDRLTPRSFLIFFNEKGNRFKLMVPARYTPDGRVFDWAVLYYKSPIGRVTLKLILDLPRILSGQGELALANSGMELLQEELRMKRVRTVMPLLEP